MKAIFQLTKDYGIRGFLVYVKLKLGIAEKISLPKISYPIYIRKKTSDFPTFNQLFTYKEYDIELNLYPKNIIDAGANIGLAAVYFANKYPESKIISIEPEESNYKVLESNIQNYKNVTALKYAISNESNQVINVVDNGYGNWGFMTESKELSQGKNIKDSVKTITINEIMEKYDFDHVDLLKIDIEGAEKELFESNYEDWLPKTKCLIIELHDRMKVGSSKSFFNAIAKYNFSYYQKGENLIFINTDKSL